MDRKGKIIYIKGERTVKMGRGNVIPCSHNDTYLLTYLLTYLYDITCSCFHKNVKLCFGRTGGFIYMPPETYLKRLPFKGVL